MLPFSHLITIHSKVLSLCLEAKKKKRAPQTVRRITVCELLHAGKYRVVKIFNFSFPASPGEINILRPHYAHLEKKNIIITILYARLL